MSDKFEEAYRRARRKAGAATWRLLSDKQQEEAVAAELRALEAEPPGESHGDDDHSNGHSNGGGSPPRSGTRRWFARETEMRGDTAVFRAFSGFV